MIGGGFCNVLFVRWRLGWLGWLGLMLLRSG